MRHLSPRTGPRAHPTALVAILLGTLFLAACGADRAQQGDGVDLDRLPAWTLGREAVIDGEFGSVVALAADSRGKIYIADGMKQQIAVFATDGRPLATIGRRGQGPGEFQGLRDIATGRGDTLFAFDVQAQRVTLFTGDPEPRLAGTVSLIRSGERANYQILVPASGGVVVPYVVPATESTADAPRPISLRYLTGNDYSASRTVLQVPEREFLVTRDPSFGFSVGSMPYGREPLLRLGPGDRLYYAWSDRFHIQTYDLAGRQTGKFQVPRSAARVSDDDVQLLLASYGADPMSQLERKQMERAHGAGRLPRTKPVLKNFLVDDRGRVWASVTNSDDVVVSTAVGLAFRGRRPDSAAEWLVVGPGGPVATVRLPHGTTLRLVRDTVAYGVETDELGVQRVARFAVRP